jgi:redox-sensitive bicupin YhaK (pirin superfamily)
MKVTVRRSDERGPADFGWLKSRHTFSFGSYYDPAHMGVSALRVINDDRVEPGAGFGAHPHRDMEIITYVKRGVIEHRDSTGNTRELPTGEFQLMSAGSGIIHSEYNASQSEPLEFLQIWIQPNVTNMEPGYQQKAFAREPGLQLIASPDAREQSLKLHQDAALYRAWLGSDEKATHDIAPGRTVYVHVVSGELLVQGETLGGGDGATVSDANRVELVGKDEAEALLFDLP